MAVSRIGEDFGRHFGELASVPEDPFFSAEFHSESVTAPAVGGIRRLSWPLVEDTLVLTNATTGGVYSEGADYLEDLTGGFKNLAIPAGTGLSANYYLPTGQGEAAEIVSGGEAPLELRNGWAGAAIYYREGGRTYLEGVIAGGVTSVGTPLFSVPEGYGPDVERWPSILSDAGPVKLVVTPSGVVSIGDGPFEAGNGWLTLDGTSWRSGPAVAVSFISWGQTDIFFGGAPMDADYGRLS